MMLLQLIKQGLPAKARKYLYPLVFWFGLPIHHKFLDNETTVKFSQCMEAVLK